MYGCIENNCINDKITRAEKLIDENPDSAYNYLILFKSMLCKMDKAQKMRYYLVFLDAQNKLSIPFTTDSIQKEVLAYYTSHGDANSRMRANYMLANAYRDMKESPKELEYFQKAIDSADTLSKNCNCKLLDRIYLQKGNLYNYLLMPKQAIEALKNANKYATIANDINGMIAAKEGRITSYDMLNNSDSVFALTNDVSNSYMRLKDTVSATISRGISIFHYEKRGDYVKAKRFIDDYIVKSGRIINGKVTIPGSEQIYNMIGSYYYGVGLLDSACYFFTKELKEGKDIENQSMGYKGLMDVYQKKGCSDSIVKYANLYCLFNDSTTANETSANILRLSSMYDYNRLQNLSDRMKHKIDLRENEILFVVLIAMILFFLLYIYYKSKRNKEKEKYHALNAEYVNKLNMYINLKDQYESLKELKDTIQVDYHNLSLKYNSEKTETENKISLLIDKNEKQRNEIATFHNPELYLGNVEQYLESADMLKNNTIQRFHKMSLKNKKISREDWDELVIQIDTLCPNFINKLSIRCDSLSYKQIMVCVLTRLLFSPYEIMILVDFPSFQSLTNFRARLCKKLFDLNGGANDFDKKIRAL